MLKNFEKFSVCGGEYKWLNESTRRYSYTSNSYCDSSLSGWYRFGGSAGTMMFSGCIRGRRSRCGTNYPGHLTGGHPGVNDGIVSRVVCFSYTQSSYHYNRYSYSEYCCYYRRTIKILNCGTFYVYKLNGTPTCNSRYCSTGWNNQLKNTIHLVVTNNVTHVRWKRSSLNNQKIQKID